MRSNSSILPRLAGAVLGTMSLVAVVPAPVAAEQVDGAAWAMKADQTPRPAAKPQKPVQRTVRAQELRTPDGAKKPWALEDALPKNSTALRHYEPPVSPGLGRMPLSSGSFGFETDTKTKPNQLPDGQTIPGLEAASSAHQNSTYLGLSLSVPTVDKSMIPARP
jgi:hypothetical protein